MDAWAEQGACRTSEPELFFPITSPGHPRLKQQITEAKAVCHRCPVIESCRGWALAHPQMAQYGVWGAMSEEERRTVRRHGDRARSRSC
nr:WhiB family transcriptional regulator [Catenulispora rubra]